MSLAPKLSLVPNPHADQSAIGAPDAAGDKELPGARPTAAERRFVRHLLTQLEERLSVDGLMFLAGGAEHQARRKRAADEAGRR
jgi:hypothetical protein